METKKTPIASLRTAEDNPRFIKEAKFEKLVDSILVLPGMLELRPVVTDGAGVVIGGNMRLEALRRIAGMTAAEISARLEGNRQFMKKSAKRRGMLLTRWAEWLGNPTVPAVDASELTADERQEFKMKDNIQYGEFDFDMLANEWDELDLGDWGMDVWQPEKGTQAFLGKEDTQTREEDGTDDTGDISALMLDDRIYDSDNEFDIPNLRADRQPENGMVLPFSAWGADTRAKKGIGTYHFYVEDYRFEAIWKHPEAVMKSGCKAVVEPNFSLFDTTPVAYGLQLIYKKRWIARYWQECGAKVYADLNVARKFHKYNRMGIPGGYNAFATRGYADREEYLKMEIQAAREISGLDKPNMLVYGGGERIKELCRQNGVLYVEQFITNKNIKKRR